MTSKTCPDCGEGLFSFTIEGPTGSGRVWGCPPCIEEAEKTGETIRYFVGFGDPDEFKPFNATESKNMTTFKPVDYRAGVQLLALDTFTPSGVYFRPFPADEVPAHLVGQALPGDFFLVTSRKDGALRASLLPWSAPVDGNIYPAGDHGVPGDSFDPRTIPGPWVPFRPIPVSESVTGSYIGAEHFEQVTGDLRSQLHEAQRLIEEAGALVGLLVGMRERGNVELDSQAATTMEEVRRSLSIRAEAWIREQRIRAARENLQDAPAVRTIGGQA